MMKFGDLAKLFSGKGEEASQEEKGCCCHDKADAGKQEECGCAEDGDECCGGHGHGGGCCCH